MCSTSACTILLILSSAALPVARYSIIYQKEALLRYELRQTRDAIDRYKDAADLHLFQTELGSDKCYVALTHHHLSAQDIMNRVRSPQAGAIVLFAGR